MTTRDYTDFVRPLPHVGEHLRIDYLPEYGLSPGSLAKAMGLKDRSRIEQLVRGKVGVSADTALRLGRVFGTSPEFWLNLQAGHELSKAAIEQREELQAIRQLEPAA